jgi:hypothetical protein
MNLLQLVNRLKRKCVVPGAVLTSLNNQVEEINRLIDYVNESWMDLQVTREDWIWMRASASCPTVLGQASYSPTADFLLSDFANWDTDSFRNYVTATGPISEIRTDFIDYDAWRNSYQFGANRYVYTRPIEITVTPSLNIGVGPSPLAGYTITGDYYKVPTEMLVATDTPAMPSQYHMIIVYKAMMYYGAAEAATEVYQEGAAEYKRFMNLLGLNQLEVFSTGGSLA